MSRGGRGGGSGGRRGPDLSWEDEDATASVAPILNIPGPLFPDRHIVRPRRLSASEKASVQAFLSFRARAHRGPIYSTLDPASLLDPKTKKPNPRAGFDPFADQTSYSALKRNKPQADDAGGFAVVKRRKLTSVPDLSAETGRGTYGYTLRLFPRELWGVLDPKMRLPDWEGLSIEQRNAIIGTSTKKSTKRKRTTTTTTPSSTKKKANNTLYDEDEEMARSEANPSDEDEDDEDVVVNSAAARRGKPRRTDADDPTQQKKGLDAEDDYPDVEQEDGPEGTGGADADAEDEPQDSEFEESDDGAGDDYNAELYFDAGEEEGADEGGDDDGGAGGGWY